MLDKDRRDLLTNEYGKMQYEDGLAQVQNIKDEYAKQALSDRKKSDMHFENFQDDTR